MLYQLSYIGEDQLSAISLQLSAKPLYSLPLPPSECITSLRRTQVFNANNARTASVAIRIRVSLNVANASAPNAAYAISAITNRFTTNLMSQQSGAQGRIRTFVPR